MLIHITPQFYAQPNGHFHIAECRLLSLQIQKLDVELKSSELVTRKPFPNKNYWVGSRNIGRKALEGLLFETPAHVPEFTAVARWIVNEEHIVTHEIQYRVLDQELDSVSDNITLWNAGRMKERDYPSRWPQSTDWKPGVAKPRMEIFHLPEEAHPLRQHVRDTISASKLITLRQETLEMPTIERSRITSMDWSVRMPPQDTALLCHPS